MHPDQSPCLRRWLQKAERACQFAAGHPAPQPWSVTQLEQHQGRTTAGAHRSRGAHSSRCAQHQGAQHSSCAPPAGPACVPVSGWRQSGRPRSCWPLRQGGRGVGWGGVGWERHGTISGTHVEAMPAKAAVNTTSCGMHWSLIVGPAAHHQWHWHTPISKVALVCPTVVQKPHPPLCTTRLDTARAAAWRAMQLGLWSSRLSAGMAPAQVKTGDGGRQVRRHQGVRAGSHGRWLSSCGRCQCALHIPRAESCRHGGACHPPT